MSLWGWLRRALGRRDQRTQVDADPGRALDEAYAHQLELQQKMRRGVADMVTFRKRLELQARQLQTAAARLETQARSVLERGEEDLARTALARRAALLGELNELRQHVAALAAEEARLLEAAGRLELQLQRFRARKEAAKAVYGAAQARVRVGSAAAGLGEDDLQMRLAVQRAEERIADMQARAQALEGLVSVHELEPPSLTGDPFERELGRHVAESEVEGELQRLRGEVADRGPPRLGEAESREP